MRKILVFIILGLAIAAGNNVYALSLNRQSPDFTLTDERNNEVRLSGLRDVPLLLLFVDEGEPSQKKLSEIAEIYDYYSASELKILTILMGKNRDEALKYQQNLSLSYTLLADPKS